MPEREARTNLIKKMDTTKPITLEMLGTKDDPCFGKFNDPRSPICMQCGDIEICAIAMGQNNHIKRAMVEQKQAFKDVEEKDLVKPDQKVIKKSIRKRIRQMFKQGITDKEKIGKDLYGKYMTDGFTLKRLNKIIDLWFTKNTCNGKIISKA